MSCSAGEMMCTVAAATEGAQRTKVHPPDVRFAPNLNCIAKNILKPCLHNTCHQQALPQAPTEIPLSSPKFCLNPLFESNWPGFGLSIERHVEIARNFVIKLQPFRSRGIYQFLLRNCSHDCQSEYDHEYPRYRHRFHQYVRHKCSVSNSRKRDH